MKKTTIGLLAMGAAIVMAGCGKQATTTGGKAVISINGAGATFPTPSTPTGPISITRLQACASPSVHRLGRWNPADQGGDRGLRRIGRPLTADELSKSDLTQFPMVIGGVVPVVNISGVKPVS